MRHCVRLFGVIALTFGMGGVASAEQASPTTRPAVRVPHDGLRRLGWQLAVPTGTFSDLDVFESIDVFHGLGVHHLELTPGQRLSATLPRENVTGVPSAEATAALMAKLKSAKMDVVSYGPVGLPDDDATARPIFAFAKAMKIKIVIATLGQDRLQRLDALASEAGVTLAVRGGPKPLNTPEALSAALAGRSARVVGCEDIAAWRRAGVDPVAATRSIGPRVGNARVPGIDTDGKSSVSNAADVDSADVLATLKQNGFKGIVTLDCAPGPQRQHWSTFVDSMNVLSDTITRLAEKK